MLQVVTQPARVLLVENEELVKQVKDLIINRQLVKVRVKGNSMFPFLRHDRDVVTLKHALPEELTFGRIVMFRFEGRHILHRIVRKRGNLLYIRGDNSRGRTLEYAALDDIVGVVDTVQRGNQSISWDNIWWKLLSFLWIKTHIIRLYMYAARRIAGRILKRI